MSDVIHLLRLEHSNSLRLLDIIDDEASALRAGEPADRELMRLAIDYFAGYPERCHHPKEELVIRRLLGRHPELEDRFDRICDDHARLGERLERLTTLLDAAPDAEADRALGDALARFCSGYRAHMQHEDADLFPAALELLDEADWEAIDFDLFDRDDPLFDHVAERTYGLLREQIRARGRAGASARLVEGEARWLAGASGPAAFNERMRGLGEPLALVTFADGSYGIEREGSIAARIPPCTPARAVWCAWYYWKGIEGEIDSTRGSGARDRERARHTSTRGE